MPIIGPGHGQAVPRGPLLCLCDCTDQGLQSTLGTHDAPFLTLLPPCFYGSVCPDASFVGS